MLPELAPHLFPFRHDFSWLKEPDFTHPTVGTLEAQKLVVREAKQKELEKIEQQIHTVEQSEEYLTTGSWPMRRRQAETRP